MFARRPISALAPPAAGGEPGWVVTNPPYGVRVGERDRVRDLYARLGNVLRARCPGWRLTMVSADPALERQLRLPRRPLLRTENGGIPIRIVGGEVPGAPSAERSVDRRDGDGREPPGDEVEEAPEGDPAA